MKTGILWMDRSDKPLAEKIQDAALAYERKHGAKADTCVLNPAAIPADGLVVPGITIKTARNILPHHIHIGEAGK